MKEEEKDFDTLEKELAHFMRALGHPARVAVLLAIANKGSVVEGETIEIPVISPTTVIQHLRELKRAGLIQGRIFGTKSKYGIDYDQFDKFRNDLDQFLKMVSNGALPSDNHIKEENP